MKYSDFEQALSIPRTQRYLTSCNRNKMKAMTLYRYNMQLSHELFSVISVLVVSLRNAFDYEMRRNFGNNWLIDAILPTGRLCINSSTRTTQAIIQRALNKLDISRRTQDNLIPNLEFGVWHHMFARPQNAAFGHKTVNVFPVMQQQSPNLTYQDLFNQLTAVNELRNRLAHHEPVCFRSNCAIKDTTYARRVYGITIKLIDGMGLNTSQMLYGIDHVLAICDKIDQL